MAPLKKPPFNFLILFLLISLSSCKKEESVQGIPQSMEVNVAYNKWRDSGITSYSFKIALRHCECDGRTYEVFVVNNAVKTVKTAEGYIFSNKDSRFETIDKLFEVIISALNKNPYAAQITYNPSYGFPVDVYIDLNQLMADEEIGFEIRDFKKQKSHSL